MVGYLRRYTKFYTFGDTFLPDSKKPGSGREWFFFRIIHSMRVRWENEQHKKRVEEAERGRSSASRSGGGAVPESDLRRRKREAKKPEADPQRAKEEGRPMTEAEKVKAAQERFGVPPHEAPQTLGRKKPKGFKSTRVKRTR